MVQTGHRVMRTGEVSTQRSQRQDQWSSERTAGASGKDPLRPPNHTGKWVGTESSSFYIVGGSCPCQRIQPAITDCRALSAKGHPGQCRRLGTANTPRLDSTELL